MTVVRVTTGKQPRVGVIPYDLSDIPVAANFASWLGREGYRVSMSEDTRLPYDVRVLQVRSERDAAFVVADAYPVIHFFAWDDWSYYVITADRALEYLHRFFPDGLTVVNENLKAQHSGS